MEPSTTPTVPSWYEVANCGVASDDNVRRKPRGVAKLSSASDVAFNDEYELSRSQPVPA